MRRRGSRFATARQCHSFFLDDRLQHCPNTITTSSSHSNFLDYTQTKFTHTPTAFQTYFQTCYNACLKMNECLFPIERLGVESAALLVAADRKKDLRFGSIAIFRHQSRGFRSNTTSALCIPFLQQHHLLHLHC